MKKILLIFLASTQLLQAKNYKTPALEVVEQAGIQNVMAALHDQDERDEQNLRQFIAQQQAAEQVRQNNHQPRNRFQRALAGRNLRNQRINQNNPLPARRRLNFNANNVNAGQEFQLIEFAPNPQVVPADNNQIVINGQHRLRHIGNNIFVIRNNIQAEEVAPIANIPVLPEHQDHGGVPAEHTIN